MPPFETTPAEANGDPSLTPAPVTRRQLREQEAREALAKKSASPQPLQWTPRQASPVHPRKVAREGHPPRRARPAAAPVPHAAPAQAPTPTPAPLQAQVAQLRRSTAASIRKRIFSNLASVGVMVGVGLIVVSTTVPANAFLRPVDSSSASASLTAQGSASAVQDLAVDDVAAPAVTRDSYTVVSAAQKVQIRTGGGTKTYTNDPNGTIQWPFESGVLITSGFGPRHVAGCGFCSTNHQGLDFNPGSGVPIHVIADGVVSSVIVSNSGLGSHVIVDHVINGQKVQTVYAHMLYGSIAVAEGQAVTVGTVLGKVGSTGASTGAHLHFEVHLAGVPVDPFAWLKANAN